MADHPLSLTVVASRANSSWRSSALSLVTSTLLQGVVITVLILIPLLATSSLPTPMSTYQLPQYVPVKVMPPYEAPPPSKPPSTSPSPPARRPTFTMDLIVPTEIADTIADPPEFYEGGLGVPGGIPFIDTMLSLEELSPTPPLVESPAPKEPVVIGGELRPPRKVVNVTPLYPAIARQTRTEGTVTLRAIIDENGNVVNLTILESVPLLDEAALDAVRQWKYEPTFLNGQAVPVVITVHVGFELSR